MSLLIGEDSDETQTVKKNLTDKITREIDNVVGIIGNCTEDSVLTNSEKIIVFRVFQELD